MRIIRERKNSDVVTLFFLHVPRTGGTALRHAFCASLGDENVVSLFTKDGPETSRAARKIMFEGDEQEERERFAALSAYLVAQDVSLFASHRSAVKLDCFEAQNAFIILREPFERLVSEYRLRRYRREITVSFEEYASHPNVQNVQSRMLQGMKLQDLGAFGLFSEYDEFVDRLSRRFNLNLHVSVTNQTKLVSRMFASFCSVELTKKIMELNRHDVELYTNAYQLLRDTS